MGQRSVPTSDRRRRAQGMGAAIDQAFSSDEVPILGPGAMPQARMLARRWRFKFDSHRSQPRHRFSESRSWHLSPRHPLQPGSRGRCDRGPRRGTQRRSEMAKPHCGSRAAIPGERRQSDPGETHSIGPPTSHRASLRGPSGKPRLNPYCPEPRPLPDPTPRRTGARLARREGRR